MVESRNCLQGEKSGEGVRRYATASCLHSRREFATLLAAAGCASLLPAPTLAIEAPMKRAIPKSGEELPVIGLGTWQTFDVGSDPAERAQRAEVLRVLFEAGGSVIDSSPMYGRAEGVVGDLLAEAAAHDRAFLATKVWTRGRDEGIAQMAESLRRFRTETLDLMQIHNLVDWRTHLETLRTMKAEGTIRYIGITHYTSGAHNDLVEVIESEPDIDFVQVNYSIGERAAERRLFPAAQAHGVAVIANLPFDSGSLFRSTQGEPLPEWTAEFDCASWSQFFLKFAVSHPAVTCAIPGTADPAHLADNLGAAHGRLPDAAMRQRMIRFWEYV